MHSFHYLALFRAWCYLAPLAMAKAAPNPEVPLAPGSSPDPEPNPTGTLSPDPEPDAALEARSILMRQIPAPPPIMGWIGSIGGLLGIISFTHTYIEKLIALFEDNSVPETPELDAPWYKVWLRGKLCYPASETLPQKKGPPSGSVAIQVGLDGAGLKGAGGEFPQICLWNNHGELIGYNDQTIRFVQHTAPDSHPFNFEKAREDMPEVLSGSVKAVGIWPAPMAQRKGRGYNQAVYVTMIKRHYDAICIASVFVHWNDNRDWLFWGRASNMSWYYSYVISSDRRDDGTCFWLDARGDLKHKKDLEEEYLGAKSWILGKTPKKEYPKYMWAANVVPESGIPEGDDLNEGMRENGVHEYKVPLGVKFNTVAFLPSEYGPNYNNLTVEDFVTNPGKMRWIMEPTRKNVRGGNPVLPILNPKEQGKYTAKHPELIWEDKSGEEVPVDCMTDDYYDEDEEPVEPLRGRIEGLSKVQTEILTQWFNPMKCKPAPHRRRSLNGAPRDDKIPPPLHERHARTLVNDQNPRGEGSSTKKLCESPHSVGPSYANHRERFFCRMTDKTLWPFCDSAAGVSHDCFDAEAEILMEKNKPMGKRSHHWDAIEDWHSEKRFKRAA